VRDHAQARRLNGKHGQFEGGRERVASDHRDAVKVVQQKADNQRGGVGNRMWTSPNVAHSWSNTSRDMATVNVTKSSSSESEGAAESNDGTPPFGSEPTGQCT